MSNSRDLQHYLALPYTIQLTREGDAWFAEIAELPGCMTQGDSAAEAVEMIQDAMAGWIEIALEDGNPVPEPRPMDTYSGKFVLRVPHSLHRDLVRAAEREGVSLNQFAVVALARAVGPVAPSPEVQPAVRRPVSHAAPRLHVAAEEEPRYGDEGA